MPDLKDLDTEVKTKMAEIEEELARVKQEEAIKKFRLNYNKKLEKIADKGASYLEKYGEEDYRTQIYVELYDAITSYGEMIDILEGSNDLMSCMDDIIKFMDQALNFNLNTLQSWNREKYGFFKKWKIRREFRKSLKNNRNRMQVSLQFMTNNMVMLKSFVKEMKKQLTKFKLKQNKGKKGGTQASNTTLDIFRNRLAAKSGENIADGSIASSGTSGGSNNIDDIL